MVLAAGLGTRMRPITDRIPKPLVTVAGRTLLDRGLDALAEAGVEKAVVNVHWLPELIVEHVSDRRAPRIAISDERDDLLDSAGGIVKALPQLGPDPFFVLNADTFWIDDRDANLARLAAAWDDRRMDFLLMLASFAQATGHEGGADFRLGDDGRVAWGKNAPDGLIYAGVYIVHPRVFAGVSPGKSSVIPLFRHAIETGRMFGLAMGGRWITVGTPAAIPAAEAAIAEAEGGRG
ncbi:MAG: nucleotidyltransferase family protein [Phyllobacteriaceae bacterium]|nr:nucleotidyltransferase family protein [Phyllobacteriaceae bacterium]